MSDGLPFLLIAIGHAILNSIWQMGLLWILVLVHSRFHSNLKPKQLSLISFIALLIGFISFWATLVIFLVNPQLDFGLIGWLSGIQDLQPVAFYAALAYLLLLIIPTARFCAGIGKTYRLRNHKSGKVPGHFKIFLLDACQYLGIKRKVRIYTSTLIASPLTFGFFKPVILFPVALLNQLSIRQVESIILHELAHIKRNDYLQNIITQIILTLLYFNPFAKLLADMHGEEREKSADNWVLQFEYNKYTYAETLVKLARENVAKPHLFGIAMTGKGTALMERIEWIFGTGQRKLPSLKSLLALALLILAAATIGLVRQKTIITPANAPFALIEQQQPYQPTVMLSNEHPETQSVAESEPTVVARDNKAPETGLKKSIKIEVQPTASQELTPPIESADEQVQVILVNQVSSVVPALEEQEEHNVQAALAATRKIVTELSWKAIEHALAETVTSEEKEALKVIYSKKLETANWQKHADLLRLHYDQINWEHAHTKLAETLNTFKMDSVYNKYKQVEAALKSYKKDLEKSKPSTELQTLDSVLQQYNTVIMKIDSLRTAKIVEL
ncbi:M56 family metallopeptidase [Niabella insulamsoli]|uniref:M56 family metallopeptidase n=1 Tax=Niabella insulamsoli TaxID=3144874 RepID=UPI0031FDF396